MAPPTRFAPSNDESMQRYMLLSSQQETIRRRMSLVPSVTPMSAPSSEFPSLAPSPIHSRSTWTADYISACPSPTNPIPAQPGVAHRHSIVDTPDAHKLSEINQEIKATLTELLNTESARADGEYRQWIQGRLLDAEHQIRQQRRRRSSSSNDDREFASSIAEHLDLLHTCKTWG